MSQGCKDLTRPTPTFYILRYLIWNKIGYCLILANEHWVEVITRHFRPTSLKAKASPLLYPIPCWSLKPFFKLVVWQPDRIACSTARLGPWMTRRSWILCWPALDVSIPRSQEVSYPWDLGNLFGILTNTVGVLGSYLAGPLLSLIGFCICFTT